MTLSSQVQDFYQSSMEYIQKFNSILAPRLTGRPWKDTGVPALPTLLHTMFHSVRPLPRSLGHNLGLRLFLRSNRDFDFFFFTSLNPCTSLLCLLTSLKRLTQKEHLDFELLTRRVAFYSSLSPPEMSVAFSCTIRCSVAALLKSISQFSHRQLSHTCRDLSMDRCWGPVETKQLV